MYLSYSSHASYAELAILNMSGGLMVTGYIGINLLICLCHLHLVKVIRTIFPLFFLISVAWNWEKDILQEWNLLRMIPIYFWSKSTTMHSHNTWYEYLIYRIALKQPFTFLWNFSQLQVAKPEGNEQFHNFP